MADDRILVAARVRPLSVLEKERGETAVVCVQDSHTVVALGPSERVHSPRGASYSADSVSSTYAFDATFGPTGGDEAALQQEVYERIGRPVLQNALQGVSGCLFAYGISGSGKTFSLFGSDEVPGLFPRLASELLELKCQAGKGSASRVRDSSTDSVSPSSSPPPPPTISDDFSVKVAFLELYNENLVDLLSLTREPLRLFETCQEGVIVPGLSESEVGSREELGALLEFALRGRSVGATSLNARSSRSHVLIQLRVHCRSNDCAMRAKVHIIDLAGSERQKRSKNEGARLKEGIHINVSLSALGLVISRLSDIAQGRQHHNVPFRDSKLTFLLKDSLAGNSRTQVLVNLSPASASYEESLSTLRFAQSVKRIRTRVVADVYKIKSPEALEAEIKLLHSELDALRKASPVSAVASARSVQRVTFDSGVIGSDSRGSDVMDAAMAVFRYSGRYLSPTHRLIEMSSDGVVRFLGGAGHHPIRLVRSNSGTRLESSTDPDYRYILVSEDADGLVWRKDLPDSAEVDGAEVRWQRVPHAGAPEHNGLARAMRVLERVEGESGALARVSNAVPSLLRGLRPVVALEAISALLRLCAGVDKAHALMEQLRLDKTRRFEVTWLAPEPNQELTVWELFRVKELVSENNVEAPPRLARLIPSLEFAGVLHDLRQELASTPRTATCHSDNSGSTDDHIGLPMSLTQRYDRALALAAATESVTGRLSPMDLKPLVGIAGNSDCVERTHHDVDSVVGRHPAPMPSLARGRQHSYRFSPRSGNGVGNLPTHGLFPLSPFQQCSSPPPIAGSVGNSSVIVGGPANIYAGPLFLEGQFLRDEEWSVPDTDDMEESADYFVSDDRSDVRQPEEVGEKKSSNIRPQTPSFGQSVRVKALSEGAIGAGALEAVQEGGAIAFSNACQSGRDAVVETGPPQRRRSSLGSGEGSPARLPLPNGSRSGRGSLDDRGSVRGAACSTPGRRSPPRPRSAERVREDASSGGHVSCQLQVSSMRRRSKTPITRPGMGGRPRSASVGTSTRPRLGTSAGNGDPGVPSKAFDKNSMRLRNGAIFVEALTRWRSAHAKLPVIPPRRLLPGTCAVYVRKRPMFEHELKRCDFDVLTVVGTAVVRTLDSDTANSPVMGQEIVHHACMFDKSMASPFIAHTLFPFDGVFDVEATNEGVYRTVGLPLVENALEGNLSTLFLFGQTGSGKTFTMQGLERLAVLELFDRLEDGAGLTLSCFELVGRKALDLLSEQKSEIRLREEEDGCFRPHDCEEFVARDADELLYKIAEAAARRATDATTVNSVSSRSHSVCKITMPHKRGRRPGCLLLVDCAGTERAKDTLFFKGHQVKDSAEINSSLFALKDCIRFRQAAIHKQGGLVPDALLKLPSVRGSPLTKVLSESLTSASAQLAAMATVSPNATDAEHTIDTLRTVYMLGGRGEGRVGELKQILE